MVLDPLAHFYFGYLYDYVVRYKCKNLGDGREDQAEGPLDDDNLLYSSRQAFHKLKSKHHDWCCCYYCVDYSYGFHVSKYVLLPLPGYKEPHPDEIARTCWKPTGL